MAQNTFPAKHTPNQITCVKSVNMNMVKSKRNLYTLGKIHTLDDPDEDLGKDDLKDFS